MEGRIAYRGADDRLHTARPDGSDARPVSPHGASYRLNGRRPVARESWPVWTPDGARIAFSYVSAEIDGGLRLEVHVADWQSGKATALFANPPGSSTIGGRIPHYAQWSSDGAYLAFVAATPAGLRLYLAAPGKEGAREVLRQAPLYLAWAPDRPALLVHVQDRHLLFDPTHPEAPKDLSFRSAVHRVSSWAPDGSAMAYVWDRPGQELALYRAGRNGDEPRLLAPVRAMAGFLWSPHGDAIAVADDQDPTMPFYARLRLVRLQGTQQELTRDQVLAFFWAPDGRRLAYVTFGTSEGALALVVLQVEAAAVKEVTRLEVVPSWGLLTMLPFFDQYAASHRLWSPDSNSLVISGLLPSETTASREEGPRVYVVDAEGKEPPRHIGHGSMAFWSPR